MRLPKEEYQIEASKTINLTKFIDINLVNSKNNNCNDKNNYSYKENTKQKEIEKKNSINEEFNNKILDSFNKNETKMDLDDEIESKYEEALKNFLTNENSIYPKIEGSKN